MLLAPLVALVLTGCSGASKLDWSSIYSRAGYQLPDRVIDALELPSGATVADLGAGDGYFTFRLADAVGPTGRVYAVDVDREKLAGLRAEVRERGYTNVTVVEGALDDPRLPDGEVDLVFVCDTYHHLDARETYFRGVRRDLAAGGRLAIVEIRPDNGGFWKLFLPAGHATALDVMERELGAAGYRPTARFDFLPLQHFAIFAAG